MTINRQTDASSDLAEIGSLGTGQMLLATRDTASFKDGDIIHAFSKRQIRDVYAADICSVQYAGHNSDGLRIPGSLPDVYQSNTYKYRFDRLSDTQVLRTEIESGAEATLDMDARHYVWRATQNPNHRIFGVTGAEYWYGGPQYASWEALDVVWQAIEDQTAFKDLGQEFPFTTAETSKYLPTSYNDMTDEKVAEYTAPLLDETDPDNPVVLEQRKHYIDWRSLRYVDEAAVEDPNIPTDERGFKHVHNQVVETK